MALIVTQRAPRCKVGGHSITRSPIGPSWTCPPCMLPFPLPAPVGACQASERPAEQPKDEEPGEMDANGDPQDGPKVSGPLEHVTPSLTINGHLAGALSAFCRTD